MSEKYLVFHIEGGLGKNIASTALLKPLSKLHEDRKIIVVASWPEVFLNNASVYRVYRIGNTPYFYDTYIKDKDTIVLRKEAYYENNHIMRKTPLMQTMFDMYGVPYTEDVKPILPMNMVQKDIISRWKREKPILLLHTNGGPMDLNQQPNPYTWTRDMPVIVAQDVVDYFSPDYHVIQVCRQNSPIIKGAEVVNAGLKNYELFALLCASSKRLLIDSCLNHAAAAFGLKSVVLWIGTHPDMFGYNLHNNIEANEPKDYVKNIDAYMFDYEFSGVSHQCPYGSQKEMFDPNTIIEILEKETN